MSVVSTDKISNLFMGIAAMIRNLNDSLGKQNKVVYFLKCNGSLTVRNGCIFLRLIEV